MVLTDVTQDGLIDVVVANVSAPTLTVLPGGGNGAFGRPMNIGTGPTPTSLAVGDFDNDGRSDFAVGGGSQITMYGGLDAGLVRWGSAPARVPSTLATADLDSDGNLDLVAGSSSGGVVSVLAGLGDGTFNPSTEYPVGSAPTSVVVADFNGDELPDVVTGGDGLSVLMGDGDRTLRAYQRGGGPAQILGLAAEDLDFDGDIDLAAAHGPNRVTVLLNSGAGAFVEGGSYLVGGLPSAIAVADVDTDSETDIVTANRGTNDISALIGSGNALYRPQTRFAVGRMPTALDLDDLDGDGNLDLVSGNKRSKSVSVLLYNANAPRPVVCLVPQVANRTLVRARRLVTDANCKLGPTRRSYSSRVRRGRVIAVSPVAGTRLPVDSTVTLLVSRGRKR